MVLGTAESLINCGKVKSKHLWERYLTNYTLDPWRGYGNGPTGLFALVDEMSLPHKKALKKINEVYFSGTGSYGNGGAMRINPVGLFFSGKNIYKNVKKTVSLTHSHPVGIDGAAVLAEAVSIAKDLDPEIEFDRLSYLDELIDFSRTDEIKDKMISVKKLLENGSSEKEAADIIGRTTAVSESMPMAVYSFLKNPDSFTECLFTAVLNGGDADTVGAMACGISGAYLGINGIPFDWAGKLERREYIEALTDMLYHVYATGRPVNYENWRASLNLGDDNELEEL